MGLHSGHWWIVWNFILVDWQVMRWAWTGLEMNTVIQQKHRGACMGLACVNILESSKCKSFSHSLAAWFWTRCWSIPWLTSLICKIRTSIPTWLESCGRPLNFFIIDTSGCFTAQSATHHSLPHTLLTLHDSVPNPLVSKDQEIHRYNQLLPVLVLVLYWSGWYMARG